MNRRTRSEYLAMRLLGQRGPSADGGRGPGRRWGGIVEKTRCLWITWIVDACKAVDVPVDAVKVTFDDVPLDMTFVELTFGRRWYWLCPRCGRRCEAIYHTKEVGCRVCLHLGYLSQKHRPSSAWRTFERVRTRHWPVSKRYFPTNEVGALLGKELGKKLRKELRALVAQVKIEAAAEADDGQ